VTLGSHQRTVGKSQTHFTPKWILDALGPFDLDPCAGNPRPWNCAAANYTGHGLEREWFGRVWLNPPFDRYQVGAWVQKLADHGNGIALLHARTEAAWFDPIWKKALAVLFLKKRISFCREDGKAQKANSGAPAVLVAFGSNNVRALTSSGIAGNLMVEWWPQESSKSLFLNTQQQVAEALTRAA